MAKLRIKDEDGNVTEIPVKSELYQRNKGGKTPYEYAVEGGYKGTEEEFVKKLVSDYLALSGGAMQGTIDFNDVHNPIDFGTVGWIRGKTTSGDRFDIFGYSTPTTLQVGGTYPALALKGKNERPTYNGSDVALHSDIPTDYAESSHPHTVSDITDLTATVDELNYVDGVTSNVQTQLNKKANDFSIEIYNGTGGNPKPVRFASFNYSTCNSENGISAKISLVSGHGNGTSYAFLEDVILRVNYNGGVEVDNLKYYGAETPTYDGEIRQYGDIFWLVDTTNKIVDFYCLMGQYARVYQTPWKRLTYSSGGTVTQYTSCTVYSSGTKVWGNNSNIALLSDVETITSILFDGNLILQPASGEGGQIQLQASKADKTNNGILLDTANGDFRIIGLESADGTTKTGFGTVLVIDPYEATITGGYKFDGAAAKLSVDAGSEDQPVYFKDGVPVATTYVKTQLENKVDLSSKQTITGNKSFTGITFIKDLHAYSPLNISGADSEKWAKLYITDANVFAITSSSEHMTFNEETVAFLSDIPEDYVTESTMNSAIAAAITNAIGAAIGGAY